MHQITGLIDKVLQDQSITQQALSQTRQKMAEAQLEKHKMLALVEQDQHRVRVAEKLQDQKLMDELALRKFQVRDTPRHA